VDIEFASNSLAKDCNDDRRLVKRYGKGCAERIRRRLDELHAASCLDDMRALPQCRCHALIGDRAGQLSVDVEHPRRLIFVPAYDPLPISESGGGLDWCRVTAVRILEITDTHG
jgi:plasmid maintenance system killer protein